MLKHKGCTESQNATLLIQIFEKHPVLKLKHVIMKECLLCGTIYSLTTDTHEHSLNCLENNHAELNGYTRNGTIMGHTAMIAFCMLILFTIGLLQ